MNVAGWGLAARSERRLIRRNKDASKKIFVATGILVFDFELFIGDRFFLFPVSLVRSILFSLLYILYRMAEIWIVEAVRELSGACDICSKSLLAGGSKGGEPVVGIVAVIGRDLSR